MPRRLASLALILLLSGCETLAYYAQAVGGQLGLLSRARPIEQAISDPATSPALRERLALARSIRDFAAKALALPDNGSYRNYAELDRPYAVWNVVAAPEFSLAPLQSCFPVAGCVSYRGFFSQQAAERHAERLRADGYDAFVYGVAAYSTLGRFDDPLLSTFIRYPEPELARLIFHELAHQVAYAKDDTVFNESFAVAVEQEGMRRWLARSTDTQQHAAFERAQRIRAAFLELVRRYRDELAQLYRGDLAPAAKRARKSEILAALVQEYRRMKQDEWGGYAGYDSWFARTPNNAQLASVAIYSQLVPAFQALLRQEDGDLARFYRAVRELAALPRAEREGKLQALAPAIIFAPMKEEGK